ncbi:MAG: HlyC/CorC family transporter [Planctomycetes bacterium]|nr:HlyC/CorC family transporter [Planctomycetota bacterium]MCC7170287.1 HlyC/CorC family transporter [Planctomycetota bacterium]
MTGLIYLAPMAALLAGSAFSSAVETALFALDADGRARLAGASRAGARLVEKLDREPERFLLTQLLLNLLVNLGFFTVSGAWAMELDGVGAFAVSSTGFLAILLLGEILPKAFAVRNSAVVAVRLAAPALFVTELLRPVLTPLIFLTDVLTGMVSARRGGRELEPEELHQLLSAASARGAVGSGEAAVLGQVLHMTELRARDAMVPRVEIAAIDLDSGRQKAEQLVRATRRSRLPAYRKSMDHIVGYVEGRDLLLFRDKSLAELVRPIGIVSESAPLDAALRLLRAEGREIAIALDEYGGTSGVLTVESIASVLFGGFADEHAKARGFHRERRDGSVVLRGTCPLATFNRLRVEPRAIEARRAVTLGGYVAQRLDRIPRPGDVVLLNSVVLRVLRVKNGAVRILVAEPLSAGETTE